MTGKVTLVGAGIGTADNITLGGLKALTAADTVLYDKLIGDGVEELIPSNAEKICVGKRASRHLLAQEEINKLLIEKAKEGKNVVRLKGGDSYLFGRGGEEAEALADEGIAFEIIPGITSAIAAPMYAGIPVTHRSLASSVHIITGHSKAGSEPNINFKALKDMGGTLVFLMGFTNLRQITEGLINAGMSEDMPCAVIERGGMSEQKRVVSVLGKICADSAQLMPPAILVVGEVCSLSNKLDFFSCLPLKGKRIVITRQTEKAKPLADKLRSLGASVSICPCICTYSLPFEIDLNDCDTVAFTSAEGVRHTAEGLFEQGKDMRLFAGLKIAAVGQKTAAELKKYGILADIIPTEQSGRGLAGEINAEGVLLLAAEDGGAEFIDTLTDRGIRVKKISVYKTDVITPENLPPQFDTAIFFSPSQVRGIGVYTGYKAVCIGSTTADEARRHGIEAIKADVPSDEGVVRAVTESV